MSLVIKHTISISLCQLVSRYQDKSMPPPTDDMIAVVITHKYIIDLASSVFYWVFQNREIFHLTTFSPPVWNYFQKSILEKLLILYDKKTLLTN